MHSDNTGGGWYGGIWSHSYNPLTLNMQVGAFAPPLPQLPPGPFWQWIWNGLSTRYSINQLYTMDVIVKILC